MIQGSITALITPFRNGAVDEDAFAALAERQIAAGAHGLVPCGTTGESATLSHEEHRRLISLCVEVARGRTPVIAGAGSSATANAIALAAHAKAVGADAALVVAPYYNRPSQEGLFRHFAALNEAVQLPIVVYNVPSRSGVDIAPETLGRIAGLANVIGVKDATGQLDRVARHAALCGPDFIQLSGDDGSAFGFNAMGGRGCISVTANVAPAAFVAMQEAALRGDFAQARAINATLARLHRALFLEPSPGPAKYACALLGLCTEEVRLPMLAPSEAARMEIRAAMIEAGLNV